MQRELLDARRAIEAIRSGVPNRLAVQLLGCSQRKLIDRFEGALRATKGAAFDHGQSESLLIKGGFGSGKSHALGFLSEQAKSQNFVVSRISINKETPLYDPSKLFHALAASATLPDRRGFGLYEAAQKLVPAGGAYRSFQHWINGQASFDSRFKLGLELFKLAERDFELKDGLVRFWCGEPLLISHIHAAMRQLGLRRTEMNVIPLKQLAYQRPQFASRLIRAAGYSGWVWLIDEVELIGSYALLQRAKSYAEIARLVKPNIPGAVVVMAITDDFESAVLRGKHDLTTAPGGRIDIVAENPGNTPMVGMKLIQQEGILLDPPSAFDIRKLYERVRELYGAGYEWSPPDIIHDNGPASSTVRQRIKRWITHWDTQRVLAPGTSVREIEAEQLTPDYSEDDQLDNGAPSVGDSLIDEILDIL